MPKGGYKVINLSNYNISTSGTTVPGIYAAIESSMGKPLMFQNITIDGGEVHSFFTRASASGSIYIIQFDFLSNGTMGYFRINSNDLVVPSRYAPPSASGNPQSDDDPTASM